MNKFELVFDIIIAVVFYGVIGLISGFLGLLLWTDLEFETLLKVAAGIGLLAAIAGAAIPLTRKCAVSILSLFAPSAW